MVCLPKYAASHTDMFRKVTGGARLDLIAILYPVAINTLDTKSYLYVGTRDRDKIIDQFCR